jgi:hypothetical protein
MTEAEWLKSIEPQAMLKHLQGKKRVLTERKLRLFAVACSRRVWEVMPHVGREAVEVAEQYADGRVKKQALTAAFYAAVQVTVEDEDITGPDEYEANQALFAALHAVGKRDGMVITPQNAVDARNDGDVEGEHTCQSAILRDIVGNPFRPVPVSPAWLAWDSGTVGKLAQTIYDERAFDRLPVLADALEEAGCADEAILSHLRGHGPHYRGCWAVDLLLGRE